jgi:hypothetical protein
MLVARHVVMDAVADHKLHRLIACHRHEAGGDQGANENGEERECRNATASAVRQGSGRE